MKKHFFSFFVLFISLHSIAQKAVITNTLLWEISGNGLKSPSYLFGTYHLVGKNFLDTLPGVMKAFNQSKNVICEVAFENEMELVQKMMPFMMLKDNSLDKILSATEYAEVDSFVRKKTPLQLPSANAFKPSALQLTLVTFIAPKNIGPDNPGLDMYFQKFARSSGKQSGGLETIEEQAELVFNAPLDRQKEALLKTVRESDRMIKEGQQLFDAYRTQNMQLIEKLVFEGADYTVLEMEQLLKNRNHAWVKKIPAEINKQSVFFAIGAAHLVGKDGLINLLKLQGYTVKPLSTR